jgi:hypothetical protein
MAHIVSTFYRTTPMAVFYSRAELLPPVPDNQTVPAFMLDYTLPKPLDKNELPDYPCLIDETTSKMVYISDVNIILH